MNTPAGEIVGFVRRRSSERLDEIFHGDANDPTEPEESRGPRVRYDPTLAAVRRYSEQLHDYDRGPVSMFDPDNMSRVDVLDPDEIVDVVRARHKRRRLIFCIGAIVVMGSIILGLIVRLPENYLRDGGLTSAHSVLVAPPEELEQMCSVGNISTEQGHRDCERACLAASCCMAAGTESCFLEQEGICGMVRRGLFVVRIFERYGISVFYVHLAHPATNPLTLVSRCLYVSILPAARCTPRQKVTDSHLQALTASLCPPPPPTTTRRARTHPSPTSTGTSPVSRRVTPASAA